MATDKAPKMTAASVLPVDPGAQAQPEQGILSYICNGCSTVTPDGTNGSKQQCEVCKGEWVTR